MAWRGPMYLANAPGAQRAQYPVPSGQDIELFEVLIDEVSTETWLRFRFLAPEIGATDKGKTFAQIEPDFAHLCAQVALPYMGDFDLHAEVVAITLLDRPVAFGQSDPDASQFVDVFRVSSGECVWEGL